ncbi:MAG TPA: hypothetical protein DDW23_04330 [Planctomycetes bacterium]|mgnify:CR=1 FL=1|nr:hypothetical protein [Planctomycetota bacterium]|tara:strand:+ start:149 stop:718 length:570 start_codon:yes stop_codon:yes gene_type:complete
MREPERSTITKRDLVQRIADHTGQTKVLVRDILQQFLDEVAGELIQGNRLEFRKFGVFEVRQRPGRMAQNPKTLEKVEVPPKRVVKFKVGNVLKKRVENGPDPSSAVTPSASVPFSVAETSPTAPPSGLEEAPSAEPEEEVAVTEPKDTPASEANPWSVPKSDSDSPSDEEDDSGNRGPATDGSSPWSS